MAVLLLPASRAQVAITGVVNAASWAAPVAPGSIIAIFGSQLASTTAAAVGFPLPGDLKGTSVTINGTAAPLYFVSPGQINAQMPSINESLTPQAESVIVTAPAGHRFALYRSRVVPGARRFTADGSGCGQAAALKYHGKRGTVVRELGLEQCAARRLHRRLRHRLRPVPAVGSRRLGRPFDEPLCRRF